MLFRSTSAVSSTLKEEGISWGISNIDDEGNIDDENNSTKNGKKIIPMDAKVPEKFRKDLEKLNALKHKLTNLETEDARIRRKGDLTQGQEHQLQRNAEREDQLKNNIQEKEEVLFEKLYGEKEQSFHVKRKAVLANEKGYDEDEDDFFDRTKGGSSNKTGENSENDVAAEAESEESLTLKWNKFFKELKHLNDTALHQANTRVHSLKERLEKLKASGDEEAFFVQNDLQLAREAAKKIKLPAEKAHSALGKCERLVRIVNPKIQCHRSAGYIGEDRSPSLLVKGRIHEKNPGGISPSSGFAPAPLGKSSVALAVGSPALKGMFFFGERDAMRRRYKRAGRAWLQR